MSPTDPEPSDVPPPLKKPRTQASGLSKDTLKMDLWDFDVIDPESLPGGQVMPSDPQTHDPSKPRSKIPQPVARSPRPLPAPAKELEDPLSSQSAVNNRTTKTSNLVRRARPVDDIGELDSDTETWAEPEARPGQIGARTAAAHLPLTTAEISNSTISAPLATESAVKIEADPADSALKLDPRSIRNRLQLSKLEKIGLGLLVLALVTTSIFLIKSSFGHLSTRSERSERPSFPIKGPHIIIRSANSYWREPVSTGPNQETVRRDTKLIPILTLEIEGGPSAIRAFFRDDQGELIGDGVTRATSPGTLEIPATAGLENLGAHAAYRTGETKPWKVEVFEAPTVDSSRQEFKKLLEIPISTDRR
jgi:hypothetical protein